MMITKPMYGNHLTNKNAVIVIALIWCYSLFLTTPPLYGWGEYVNESANISCSVNWESRTFAATSYIIFLFILGLVLPLIVIFFSYTRIALTVRQSHIRMGRVSKKDTKVTWMVLVMIIAFLVAWTPYAVLALIIAFGDHQLVTPVISVVPALVAKSSIIYNPVIYVGLNTQFRRALRHLMKLDAETTHNGMENTTTRNISLIQSINWSKNAKISKVKLSKIVEDVATTSHIPHATPGPRRKSKRKGKPSDSRIINIRTTMIVNDENAAEEIELKNINIETTSL